ncbi:hypothetical protein ABZW96_31300 [Nocardia sp. NPDC004168]|uniref:hypothetical protein n=1 Tax=Nocardia sp. NPDC004168 TaxID=3154452 RepID=UPI0033B1AD00
MHQTPGIVCGEIVVDAAVAADSVLNQQHVVRGRISESIGECVADYLFFSAHRPPPCVRVIKIDGNQ